jgi:hypothetical protein
MKEMNRADKCTVSCQLKERWRESEGGGSSGSRRERGRSRKRLDR